MLEVISMSRFVPGMVKTKNQEIAHILHLLSEIKEGDLLTGDENYVHSTIAIINIDITKMFSTLNMVFEFCAVNNCMPTAITLDLDTIYLGWEQ